jgi:hypothetical protein
MLAWLALAELVSVGNIFGLELEIPVVPELRTRR